MKKQMAMRLAVAAALLFGLTSAGTAEPAPASLDARRGGGAENLEAAQSRFKNDIVEIWTQQQYEVVQPGGKSALAIHFELAEDWHFYADAKTAPGGMNLKIKPSAEEDYISFSELIFPQPHLYFDKSSGKELTVFSDKFTIFLPFSVELALFEANEPSDISIKIGIEGAVCSDIRCRLPDFGRLSTKIQIFSGASMSKAKFALPVLPESVSQGQWTGYSVWFALGLAFLAGLVLNIMPCVWPVIPIIVMRVLAQAKESKLRSVGPVSYTHLTLPTKA